MRFIVASGRQYYNLRKQFEGYNQDLIYISENGSMVFDKGEIVYLSEISAEKLIKPVEIARRIKGASIILCEKKVLILKIEENFLQNMQTCIMKD